MDINELESFKMSDAIKFHDELNPNLWNNDKLDPEVRKQLLLIAEDFITTLGIKDLAVKDITVSGSNAAYTYTPHSDLDLHILVDFNELPNNEVYQELFNAKKIIYNDSHNITVHGVPVELYVQDTNLPVVSLGEYSVLNDKWIRIPKKQRANLDQEATRAKFDKLAELVELALQTRDPTRVSKTLDTIKRYRKAGLANGGEFSPENLAFKAIRKQGGIQDLYDLKNELHSEKLSIEEAASREDAILKIKKLRNLKGRTPNEVENVNRIIANLMKQWNIQPSEIGIREPVDPLKAKIAKAAYEKNTAANMFKQEWERFKKGIFAEQETDEDYDPNGPPPGPEFKPTMPAGTVRVDVSDVYDWYKLGQHISNMKGLGKHDFGKGPPSTILSFGDEDTEHEYIQDLEKTGLTTTDIDPVDPNQPKGMKRQKTDPTFNVNETDDRTAAVLKIQKHLNKKYGANLDLDGKLGPLTLKSINKFMPRASKGLADEPNKTTAVQGKKLKEAERTFAPQITPLQQLVNDYGYFISTGTVHLEKNGETPEAQQRLLALVQRLQKDAKTFVGLDKSKMEANRDAILNHIHQMMQYAIPILKKYLPADKWEAKREPINRLLTAYNSARQINEASGYIPSEKEKNDPRFKTALTVDVRPDANKKNAQAFGWKISRAGIPPQARPDGKIK